MPRQPQPAARQRCFYQTDTAPAGLYYFNADIYSYFMHKVHPLLAALLLCSCQSEYTTVLRNDTTQAIRAEFFRSDLRNDTAPAYELLLDSCCQAREAAGKRTIRCTIKPGGEVWLGQEYKWLDVVPPLDWDAVVVEMPDNSRTTINALTATWLVTDHSRSRSCGDCGPLRVLDIIAIQ